MSKCIECGVKPERVIQHHTNYSKDETVPVCQACHRRIHGDENHELYPIGEPEQTSIRIQGHTADELFDRKKRGESYEDVIWRLIEQADGRQEVDNE